MTTSAPSKAHLPALDGVRGIAILVVLVHNLSIIESRDTKLEKLWNGVVEMGWVGVQLFFALSGFLITGILLDDRARPHRLKTFYVRRTVRIFPLYYAFLVVYFLILPPFVPALRRSFGEVVWYWMYLSNWSTLAWGVLPGLGHVWSLAVEEQFYLVWPWIAGRVSDRVFAWVCIATAVLSLASRVVLHRFGFDDHWLYSSTIARIDALAIGALVALAVRSDTWRPKLARALRPAGVAVAIALAVLAVVTHGINRNNPLMQIYGYSILAIGCALFVAYAARPDPPRWLAHPVLRFFGKYSYGIYVIHLPVKVALVAWQKPFIEAAQAARPVVVDLAFEAVVGAVSIGLALLSWVALERPLLRLKDRFAPR